MYCTHWTNAYCGEKAPANWNTTLEIHDLHWTLHSHVYSSVIPVKTNKMAAQRDRHDTSLGSIRVDQNAYLIFNVKGLRISSHLNVIVIKPTM